METNKHHIIFRKNGGAGLPYNRMVLPVNVHSKLHYMDDRIDEELVEKDNYYYLILIGCAYKMEK